MAGKYCTVEGGRVAVADVSHSSEYGDIHVLDPATNGKVGSGHTLLEGIDVEIIWVGDGKYRYIAVNGGSSGIPDHANVPESRGHADIPGDGPGQ